MSSRCVLLLTYGEPPTPGYLPQLQYSWRILLGLTRSVAPIPAPLLPIIALQRARMRQTVWTLESYGSPLERITQAQARRVQQALVEINPDTRWDVQPAYEFRDPLLADRIASLPEGAPVDVVPMYATCSAFTHDLSRSLLATLQTSRFKGRSIHVLAPLPESELASLMVDHVKSELRRLGVRTGPDWALLLAAHGTLLSPSRPIETGRVATQRLCVRVAAGLREGFGKVCDGWLNHVYGGRWTQPPADQALARLVAEGYRKVVYFPYGFLADNAESELEGRQVLRTQAGIESIHVPCLNDSPALARLVARRIAGNLPLRAAR